MENQLEVVNNALIYLGEPPLQELGLEKPGASAAAGALWNGALKEVLRSHPWNFAVRRVQLAPLAVAPSYGFSYQYQRPADWLRTLETSARDYRHEGKLILCDASALNLRYIARIDDLTVWDALACAALARNLAAKLAYPLTQSTSLQQAQWEMYVALLNQARGVDAQEEPSEDFEESSLITARYS